ncbi:MAG: selenide, water dikinase SelD, partial [Deltaproteobacteria bacterium]|nr:selenide, water dikinase SelD [Deltaproteobacteria bacterium]
VLKRFDVHAATDVTGFGLAGHALEMAKASGAVLKISLEDLPIMDEALTMYQKGMSTGVNKHNEMLVKDYLQYLGDYPEWHKQILLDPQTSGGLLVAIPEEQAAELVSALEEAETPAAALIGKVASVSGTAKLVIS